MACSSGINDCERGHSLTLSKRALIRIIYMIECLQHSWAEDEKSIDGVGSFIQNRLAHTFDFSSTDLLTMNTGKLSWLPAAPLS